VISSILVIARGTGAAAAHSLTSLTYIINNRNEAQAVNPAWVMAEFFDTFLKSSADILLLVSLFVTVVAAISILVSIYNSISARKREVAILRALGATRHRVLLLICLEATLIGLVGGLIGLATGHLLSAAGSAYMRSLVGEGINWLTVRPEEWLYLGVVVVIALLAGLVPALKAYKTPVATNLTTS
jgi:putative ABC transport system permease protein